MITSINEWRNRNKSILEDIGPDNSQSNEIQMTATNTDNKELFDQIKYVADYAKDLELSKPDTIGVVQKIFVDPAQAPDDISVSFTQMHLKQIVDLLDQMPDEDFPQNPMTFTTDMENNDFPFECVMYIPDNNKISKLSEVLNSQIQKKDFKSLYENNIFFINSLDKLNESNQTKVMDILKECNAVNIGNQLKWKRKLQ